MIIIMIMIIKTFIYTAQIQLCSFQMCLTIKDQKSKIQNIKYNNKIT